MGYGSIKVDNIEPSTGGIVDLTAVRTSDATTSDSGYLSAADKTKLDGIEDAATADQTGAEIKTAYEAEADTNAFTDSLKSKLEGIDLTTKADLVDSVIPTSQIPAIAITAFLGEVANETAMLALTGQQGDWCLRQDEAVGYVITGSDPTQASNWSAVTLPGSAVTSINSQVGTVVLAASDVNAVADTGDNMTGNLTLGTDKVVLDATSGAAEFASSITASRVYALQDVNTDRFRGYRTSANGTTLAFRVHENGKVAIGADDTPGNNPKTILDADGSAEFAGGNINLYTNGSAILAQGATFGNELIVSNSGTIGQTRIGHHGAVYIDRVSNNTDKCFTIDANSVEKVSILANGSATFAGYLQVDGAGSSHLYANGDGIFQRGTSGADVIALNNDGSGTFTGDIVGPRIFAGPSSTAGVGFQVYQPFNGNAPAATILGDGSASFSGAVDLYDGSASNRSIRLQPQFGGFIEINSTAASDTADAFRIFSGDLATKTCSIAKNGSASLAAGNYTIDKSTGDGAIITHNYVSGSNTTIYEVTNSAAAGSSQVLAYRADGSASFSGGNVTIDANGNTLLGMSSYLGVGTLQVKEALAVCRTSNATASSQNIGTINFSDTRTGTYGMIKCVTDAVPGTNDYPGRLQFHTCNDGGDALIERMRIASDGFFNVYTTTSGGVRTSRTSGSQTAFFVFTGATSVSNGTLEFQVMANGDAENANNSYTGFSDIKLKENIVDASSQWEDIKALKVRKYNFKEETGHSTHTQIGLVAQEVEAVSPGLVKERDDVDAEGNDLGTTTKSVNYSVLYMKSVKALQEAIARIESLEAEVEALKSAES